MPTGNRCTAQQWAGILSSLGHEVVFELDRECELLVALHAVKSHAAIGDFQAQQHDAPVVLALTGTDIYPEPNGVTLESIAMADALVLLQDRAVDRVPTDQRHKVHVIVQSVEESKEAIASAEKSRNPFLVCVAGHLRDVKDPLRAAEASRLLPVDSKIRIEHVGAIMDPKYEALVAREQRDNPRYLFVGEQSPEQVRALMRRSRATVLSSFAEGGARVIGESIVEGTPVLATRIEGTTGLIGEAYPGLFTPGDTAELAALLEKLESDSAFEQTLCREVTRLAPKFDPALERDAWRRLIEHLQHPMPR